MPRKGENIYKRKDGRWEGRYIGCYDENHMLSWMSSKATICSMFPLQIHHPEMRLILS